MPCLLTSWLRGWEVYWICGTLFLNGNSSFWANTPQNVLSKIASTSSVCWFHTPWKFNTSSLRIGHFYGAFWKDRGCSLLPSNLTEDFPEIAGDFHFPQPIRQPNLGAPKLGSRWEIWPNIPWSFHSWDAVEKFEACPARTLCRSWPRKSSRLRKNTPEI